MTAQSLHISAHAFADQKTISLVPEWVPVLPVGRTELPERGTCVILDDVQRVIQASQLEFPLTADHRARFPDWRDSRAYGWIQALAPRNWGGHDYLAAKIAWTEEGKHLITGRAFRHLSAEVTIDQHCQVLEITGLTLTNVPAIKAMPALFHADHHSKTGESAMSETNQPVSGNDGQSKSPINSRPALHHDHAHLGRTHSSDTHLDDTTLPRLQNSEEQSPVATLIRQGRLAPAQRGWAERYYARDPEGFVQFASTQPVASIAGALPAANPDTVLLSEQQSQIARKLGLTHAQYASALSSSISLASDPLADATTGFRAAFNLGLHQAQPSWEKIAMMVPSTGAKETHAWLNSLPGMREWLGARVTSSTTRSAFTISNRLFEATVGVQRTEFEDDTIGTYTRAFEIMGANAAEWPDDLVWEIIRKGFSELCYDGKPFFAADHPWKDAAGKAGKASNLQTGTATPWYLFDTSKPAKALIFQQRVAPQLERRERGDDPNVFDKDQYLYGARARGNAGYGLWQLAWGSKADLTEANLNKAIETMMSLRHDYGRTAGVRPTLLVVPPSLRAKALSLVTVQNLANGASNPNFNAVEVHIEPRLA